MRKIKYNNETHFLCIFQLNSGLVWFSFYHPVSLVQLEHQLKSVTASSSRSVSDQNTRCCGVC